MSIGVSEEHFWESSPKDLEPYIESHNMRERLLDQHMWLMGIYINNAVGVAVSRALNGSKSRAKYLERPFSEEPDIEERTPQENFARFSAWAIAYNDNFTRTHSDG